MVVTYEDLFTFCMVLIGVAELTIQVIRLIHDINQKNNHRKRK